VVPVFVTVAYSNSGISLSYKDRESTLYLTVDSNGQVVDTSNQGFISVSSKSYKLSNVALWASIPLNISVGSTLMVPSLGEYANDCDPNNLSFYDYSDSIKYGPDGTQSKEDYLSVIYLFPSGFLTKCDTDSPSIVTDSKNIIQSFNDLELYVIGEVNSIITARWASPDSCDTSVRFLYCGTNQDCGDTATDQNGVNGPCNGFCNVPLGGSSICTVNLLVEGGYAATCLTTEPPTPWYKRSVMLGLIAGFAGLLIIGIIAIIIYIHKSHEKSNNNSSS